MNRLGQFFAAVLAGISGILLINYYKVEGFAKTGVFFVLFLVFGIAIEYLIRYFRK